MFSIIIEDTFAAAHALRFPDGSEEEIHGHNWQVEVEIAREELDEIGFVCDFHPVEDVLKDLLTEFHNKNLNAHDYFMEVNPTAERVAEYIFRRMEAGLRERGVVLEPAKLSRVSVTEAPGCRAVYRTGAF